MPLSYLLARWYALTAASSASAACAASNIQHTHHELHSAAAPHLLTLTASQRCGSQASHAMAQSQLTIGGRQVKQPLQARSASSLLACLPGTLQPRAQLHPAHPS